MKSKLGLLALMLMLASCGGGGGSSASTSGGGTPSSTLPTLSWDNGNWGEVSWQ